MNENEVPCPDPNEPVTRRILDEVLEARLEEKFLEFEKRIGLQIKAAIEDANERWQRDFAQLSKTLIEELRSEFRGAFGVLENRVDELEPRVTGLEPRVTQLEQRATVLEAPRVVRRKRAAPKRKKR